MKLKFIVNAFFILTLSNSAMAVIGMGGGANSPINSYSCNNLDTSSLEKSFLSNELTEDQATTLRSFKIKQTSCMLSEENAKTWNTLTSIEEKIAFLSLLMIQSPGAN